MNSLTNERTERTNERTEPTNEIINERSNHGKIQNTKTNE